MEVRIYFSFIWFIMCENTFHCVAIHEIRNEISQINSTLKKICSNIDYLFKKSQNDFPMFDHSELSHWNAIPESVPNLAPSIDDDVNDVNPEPSKVIKDEVLDELLDSDLSVSDFTKVQEENLHGNGFGSSSASSSVQINTSEVPHRKRRKTVESSSLNTENFHFSHPPMSGEYAMPISSSIPLQQASPDPHPSYHLDNSLLKPISHESSPSMDSVPNLMKIIIAGINRCATGIEKNNYTSQIIENVDKSAVCGVEDNIVSGPQQQLDNCGTGTVNSVLHAINVDPTDITQVIIGGQRNINLKCNQYDKAYSRPSPRHVLLHLIECLFVEDGQCVLGDYSYKGHEDKKPLYNHPLFLAALVDVKRKFPDFTITQKEVDSISSKCLFLRNRNRKATEANKAV